MNVKLNGNCIEEVVKKNSKVKDELETIRMQNGGVLRPKDVIEFAEDENTALHNCFDWDDTIAAHNWRLQQARQIIAVKVTYIERNNEVIKVRAYQSLTTDRGGDSYRSTIDILSNAELREQMIKDAKKELQSTRVKYNTINELSKIWDVIDSL